MNSKDKKQTHKWRRWQLKRLQAIVHAWFPNTAPEEFRRDFYRIVRSEKQYTDATNLRLGRVERRFDIIRSN